MIVQNMNKLCRNEVKLKDVRLLKERKLPDGPHIMYSESWMTFEFPN